MEISPNIVQNPDFSLLGGCSQGLLSSQCSLLADLSVVVVVCATVLTILCFSPVLLNILSLCMLNFQVFQTFKIICFFFNLFNQKSGNPHSYAHCEQVEFHRVSLKHTAVSHHLRDKYPSSLSRQTWQQNRQKVRHAYSRLWSFAFPLGSNCLQLYLAIPVKPRSIRATETFLSMVDSRTNDAGISITGPDNIPSYFTWIEAWSSLQTRFSESPLKTLFRQVGTNELEKLIQQQGDQTSLGMFL